MCPEGERERVLTQGRCSVTSERCRVHTQRAHVSSLMLSSMYYSLAFQIHSLRVKQTPPYQVCPPISLLSYVPEVFIASPGSIPKKRTTKPCTVFHLVTQLSHLQIYTHGLLMATGPGTGSCPLLHPSQWARRLPHVLADSLSCWRSRGELVWLSGED